MPLSKNVVRSMTTEIEKKKTAAKKHADLAEALNAEAKSYQEYLDANSPKEADGTEDAQGGAPAPKK